MAVSVIFAVLAAAANAAASVLQRKAASHEPEGGRLTVRMLLHLARTPAWLAGITSILIGFGLQAAALATGPILVIQPILIVELGFTLVLSSLMLRARLHAREWLAVAGMSAGVAVLLVSLGASGGDPGNAPLAGWILGCLVTIAVVAILVTIGYRHWHAHRAAYLGIACGIWFGFTAALVDGAVSSVHSGLGDLLQAWQTYAIVVVGPSGFFLLQNTLRSGSLVASQPGLTLSNPLASVGWGIVVFGEQAQAGAWLLGDLIGAVMVAASTVLLARSPLLHGSGGADERGRPRRPSRSR